MQGCVSDARKPLISDIVTATATIISMTHTEQKLPWERMNSEISPI